MTLTQATRMFRFIVKISSAALALFLIFRASILIIDIFFPSEPLEAPLPPVTASFGPLPPLITNKVNVSLTANYSTQLDLIAAGLPERPQVAFVFPILKSPYGFLSEDRAEAIAETFDFTNRPTQLSSVEKLWSAPNRTLRINEQTLNFKYEYAYKANPSVFVPGELISQEFIAKRATVLATQHGFQSGFANDLVLGDQQIWLLKYQNQRLQPTDRIVETSSARVDYQRTHVRYTISELGEEIYAFVSPDYVSTLTYMIFTPETTIELKHTLWRYGEENAATYPILASEAAWDMLQQDIPKYTVYIGNLVLGPMDRPPLDPVVSQITARNIFFAYYNSEIEQDYLQPVWVFTGRATLQDGGDLDWIAYVPAVHPDYIQGTAIEDIGIE